MTARTRGYRIRAGDRGYQVRAGDPGGRAGAGARGERVRAGAHGGQLRAEPCVDRVDDGPDRGAASILLLAIGLVVVLAGLGGAAIGTARVARHQAQNATDLADIFCREARLRIDQHFATMFDNHDDKAYKVAVDFLKGEYQWVEGDLVEGIMPSPEAIERAVATMEK